MSEDKPSEQEAFLAEGRSRPAPTETFRIGLTLDSNRHKSTGNTRHMYGSPLNPEQQVPVPAPAALAVVRYDDEGGFYLLYLDPQGRELTDTWHETLEAAKDQAEFEFGVRPSKWPDN